MRPSATRSILRAATLVAAMVVIPGCAGEELLPPETLQAVNVTVSTTGEDVDTDGYTVTLGSEASAVGADGSATFDELASGQYAVTLSGLAPNCSVTGGATRSATVTESQGTSIHFDVVCESVLVNGAFTDASCPGLSLQASSAPPLGLIPVGTVSGELQDPLYAYVAWAGGDEVVVSVADRATDGSAALVAPYHPSGSMDGGDVSVRIAGGVYACPTVAFSVEPLPAAPGELEAVVDLLQELVEIQAALVGTSVAELQSLDGTSLPAVQMIPLLVAQSVIDHPANPNSLRAVAGGTAPHLGGLGLDALERALAGTGLREALDAALAQLRPVATTAGRVPAAADALDCLVTEIDTAEELHDCMELAASAAFKLDGVSGEVLSDIGTAAGLLGAAPNPGVKVGSAVVGAAAFALQKLREGTASLLPSEFVSMALGPSPASFLEDQPGPGTWTAHVTATSRGWELDQSVLESLAQLAGGLSTYDAWLDSFVDPQDLVDLSGFIINQVVSQAIAGSGGAGILQVPPAQFGPIDVSEEAWSDRNLVPEMALVMTGHAQYEPREPGEGVLSVRTKDGMFGNQQINRQETLTVQALQVTISPDDVTLAPGQSQDFTVRVTSSVHPDSVEIHPETTLAGQAEMTYGGADTHTVSYTAPPAPTPSEPDVLTVRHTGQGGARGFSTQERTASATIRFVQVQLAPVLRCVQPGDQVQLQATVTPPSSGEELTWTASAGEVSSSGLFTAPDVAGPVQIRVALASNPEINDTITIPVGSCICRFTVQVGASATYVGQPGDIVEYFAFETGDTGQPWAVGYVNLQAASGRAALFAVDIAETLVTGPGSYPVPEIGGDLGYGAPYGTYGDDGATLEIYEFEPHTTLTGAIVNGTVHDSNDPDGTALSISATFSIYPPPGPFYGTASCQVTEGGG